MSVYCPHGLSLKIPVDRAGKFSQQNRSEQGAVIQADLMTLFRTAELQQQNPVEAVLAAVKSAIVMRKTALIIVSATDYVIC